MSACPNCPLAGALNAAETLLAERDPISQEQQQALGGVALTRRALEETTANLTCTNPTIDNDGQIVCPLNNAAHTVRSFAYMKWNPGQYTVSLSDTGQKEETSFDKKQPETGQYL